MHSEEILPSQREETHIEQSRCELRVLVVTAQDVDDSSGVEGDEHLT